ncbi:CsbD family protein [Methylobacterium sp. WL116]|uniref:CsbD family protein n=1 Tax=Methylobacterium sp. WL116 TaxID=2603889 RepID=UPI0011CB9FA5|nr:CsbD family protein [Methylobacterium sp. WL116]TXM93718.1 CsbD family protein [Methylobacterium sp. WL116]
MVDTDRIVGGAKELGGKMQGAAGDFVGSNRDSAEGRLREAGGKTQEAYGQAKDTVRNVADEAGDRAQEAYGQAEDAYGQARSKLRDVADNVTDYASDAYDRRGDYLRDGRQAVSSRVEENPLIALVLAGAVGYGLALLLHGRR